MDYREVEFSREQDCYRVKAFIIETHDLDNSFQTWIPTRLDNIKHGPCGTPYTKEDDEQVLIWEEVPQNSEEPKIVALVIREGSSDYHIQLHPSYHFLEKKFYFGLKISGKNRKQIQMKN